MMGHDSKLEYDEVGEGLRPDHRAVAKAAYRQLAELTAENEQRKTAVTAHLHAALHALREHDCQSVERHIQEAMNLL